MVYLYYIILYIYVLYVQGNKLILSVLLKIFYGQLHSYRLKTKYENQKDILYNLKTFIYLYLI